MLEILNLTYHRNNSGSDKKLFQDFSFRFEKKKVYAVTGPNGCGKSTLSALIMGYIKPWSGQVILDGVVLKEPSSDRVLITQEYDLFNWLTVAGNLKLVRDNDLAISELLEGFGLTDYRNSFPGQLSGGLKKRLSVARALLVNSKVIILDEAFAPLDKAAVADLQSRILKIREERDVCIIIITHNLEDVMPVADVILTFAENPFRLVDSKPGTR